ncbi:hypothetical protein TR80_009545 [Xanthomonas campestris]|nr:hypothetical protein TR80_009545 [Xanthomonas campestris]
MSQSNGWSSAQAPRFVAAPAPQIYVPPAKKHAEAEALRRQIDAHLAAGGRYEVVQCPPTQGKAMRGQALRSLTTHKDR